MKTDIITAAVLWGAVTIPQTGGLKYNKNLFLTVLEAGVQYQGTRRLGLVRTHFLVHKKCLLQCLHRAEGAKELLGLFYKGTNPILESFAHVS